MNPIDVHLATDRGLCRARYADFEWADAGRVLTSRQVTCVTARDGLVLAGTMDGVLRSEDGGHSWAAADKGPAIGHIRWLAGTGQLHLAGTEPAGIFRSEDGGHTWLPAPEVAEMRERFGWFLPYSPEAGCVRGFSLNGRLAYAAVEVGGLLRSEDGARSWQLVEGSDGRPNLGPVSDGAIHPDVHSIVAHPKDADRLYAPTGGGFFVSGDGGASWRRAYPSCYCRAVWVDPGDPDHLVLGPADSVDRNGRIEASTDGGKRWHLATAGLDTPWVRHMVERFTQVGPLLLAVLSNGEVLASRVGEWHWRRLFDYAGAVRCVAAAQ